jgi:hypothetical protein
MVTQSNGSIFYKNNNIKYNLFKVELITFNKMATRKQRGLSERIYLLEAKLNDFNEWNLSIKGSSKRIYKIILSEDYTKCKCMDFTIRHKVCKHLYFVLGRIINNSELSNRIKVVDNITDNFDNISKLLKNVLSNHVCNKKEYISYDAKETCCICFEEFGDENIEQCKMTCKNIFHSECINLWLSQNNSCPLCRSSWLNELTDNPLEEFKGLTL